MEPIPSTILKVYPKRGPLQQYRFKESFSFTCFRCGEIKISKLISIYSNNWSQKLCNGCYGRLLSLYEIKTGTAHDDEKAENLGKALLLLVPLSEQRKREQLFITSENRAKSLSPEALRFLTTAEHIASQLESNAHLEWSPAVIGLCKAVEKEIISCILLPLANEVTNEDLKNDKLDKDFGRIASFCSDPKNNTPPELGTFSHFLQTAINSNQRRQSSPLIICFLRLTRKWVDSTYLLDLKAFHSSLGNLINFRNRAAHIEELDKNDYNSCREITIGNDGILWKIIISTMQSN